MNCSICQHPRQAEMIIDYAYTLSLRVTANNYGVGYRSLQRHIKKCIYALMKECEQRRYEQELAETAELLTLHFTYQQRPRRKRSIITRKVECNWGRRAWERKKRENGTTPNKPETRVSGE